jgi:hypothetical protein
VIAIPLINPAGMTAVVLNVAVSITRTPFNSLPTYAKAPSGVNAIAVASFAIGKVVTTVLVAVLITEIVPTFWLLPTQTNAPSGVEAIGEGPAPTGTVAVTVFVAVSITETVLAPTFVT